MNVVDCVVMMTSPITKAYDCAWVVHVRYVDLQTLADFFSTCFVHCMMLVSYHNLLFVA